MVRILAIVLALVAVTLAGVLIVQNRAPDAIDGAAGLTEPEEVIEARRVLMIQIEQLMRPLDEFTVEGNGDLTALRTAGRSIEAMMLAFAHLFPPATNLYDATTRESPTYTLPAVWDDFATFQTFAERSEEAAAAVAESEDAESLRMAARSLRASCDTCHAIFTRPYTPPKVTQEDLEFDFDSVFPQN